MLIRSKILMVLLTFILAIFITGFSYFYFSNKQYGYFLETEKYVKARELAKSIADIFAEQVRAYDYYVYLHEETEKFTFNEKKSSLLNTLEEAEKLGIESMGGLKKEINRLNGYYLSSLSTVERYGRDRAIRQNEKVILDTINSTREEINRLIEVTEQNLDLSRKRAVSYKNTAARVSILIFILGLAVLSTLSFNIYRAIMAPLKKVEKAAHALGQGDLNYKLDIKQKNEFANIADSINQMASDLKEFHLKVTQMGKMAAIGELAGGVAHEINNPLTGILGHAQILLKKVPEKEEIYPTLNKIERAAIRCRNIVADLLDFSRQEKSEVDIVNINKVLDDTFSFCENEIVSKGIELSKKYSSGLPKIQVSPRTIQHAFLNIINNAIFAMPQGGKLTVGTKPFTGEGKEYVEVFFSDSGVGFDEETAKHMFDPFFTTRDVGEGTGLGLSLTYRIVKNHNGFVEAESKGSGKGALFRIRLPVGRLA